MNRRAVGLDERWSVERTGADRHVITVSEVRAPASTTVRRPAAATALLLRHMLGPYLAHAEAADPGEPKALRPGLTLIEDLRRQPRLAMGRPFHAVDVVIPWSVFDRLAEQMGAAPIGGFEVPTGVGLADRTIEHLIEAMLPSLREGAYAGRHYAAHLTQALAAHVAHAYGRLRPTVRPARGGLAPHVLRRAQAILRAHLRDGMPLEALAEACGLSPRHFARAFQESAGVTPHRWLINARIAAAKTMIGAGQLSLAQIADACGFSDQSHLTRLFKRELGVSPAAWRRTLGGADEPGEGSPPRDPSDLALAMRG